MTTARDENAGSVPPQPVARRERGGRRIGRSARLRRPAGQRLAAAAPLAFLLLLLATWGCRDPLPPAPEELREPEPPTPPPVLSDERALLAVLPQEPLPEGVRPTTPPVFESGQEGGVEATTTAAVRPAMPSPPPISPAPTVRPAAPATSTGSASAGAEPASPRARAAADGTLQVVEIAVARRVVGRAPQGEGPFDDGTEVACFTRLLNPGGERRRIRHVWYQGGSQRSSIPLSVRLEEWRTWSNVRVAGTGEWRVDVVDEAGAVLASAPFVVR